jgi:hypothetical protein
LGRSDFVVKKEVLLVPTLRVGTLSEQIAIISESLPAEVSSARRQVWIFSSIFSAEQISRVQCPHSL